MGWRKMNNHVSCPWLKRRGSPTWNWSVREKSQTKERLPRVPIRDESRKNRSGMRGRATESEEEACRGGGEDPARSHGWGMIDKTRTRAEPTATARIAAERQMREGKKTVRLRPDLEANGAFAPRGRETGGRYGIPSKKSDASRAAGDACTCPTITSTQSQFRH